MDPDQNDNSQGHPAYQSILDALPEDLHGVILPQLQEWDRGVQQKLQEVRSPYEPYKEILDQKVDPEFLQQALYLTNLLESDPNEFVQRANEHFDLGYVPANAQAPQTNQQEPVMDDLDGYSNDLGYDITKDPRYQALAQAVEQMQETHQQREQRELEEQQQADLESILDELSDTHKEDGEFDRLFVTALMAQGAEPEAAVQQFYTIVNQAAGRIANPNQQTQQQTNPAQQTPVVMGGNGGSGSGIPAAPVRMGDLKTGQVQDLVLQMLQQSQANNQ